MSFYKYIKSDKIKYKNEKDERLVYHMIGEEYKDMIDKMRNKRGKEIEKERLINPFSNYYYIKQKCNMCDVIEMINIDDNDKSYEMYNMIGDIDTQITEHIIDMIKEEYEREEKKICDECIKKIEYMEDNRKRIICTLKNTKHEIYRDEFIKILDICYEMYIDDEEMKNNIKNNMNILYDNEMNEYVYETTNEKENIQKNRIDELENTMILTKENKLDFYFLLFKQK